MHGHVKTDGTKTVQSKRTNDLFSFELHLVIDFVLTEQKLAHGPVKFLARSISHFAMNIIMAKTDSTAKVNSEMTYCQQSAKISSRQNATMRNRYAIKVGQASFLLLVMSYTGGTGPCATNLFKRVAAMRAKKHHSTYSTVITLIQCCLSFALLQSSISCLGSARSSFHCPGWVDLRAADLAATVG